MKKEVYGTRYVVMTALGKPLFIGAKQKVAIKKKDEPITSYCLTEDLMEAIKCVNLAAAKTLIEDYIKVTQSTKTFSPHKIDVTYCMEDDSDE